MNLYPSYQYLGDYSSGPPEQASHFACHKCKVSWTGVKDECPRCEVAVPIVLVYADGRREETHPSRFKPELIWFEGREFRFAREVDGTWEFEEVGG